jgi:hypothetical protein
LLDLRSPITLDRRQRRPKANQEGQLLPLALRGVWKSPQHGDRLPQGVDGLRGGTPPQRIVRGLTQITGGMMEIAPLLEMISQLRRDLLGLVRIAALHPLPHELVQSRAPQGHDPLV